jgi:orotate phosphoribosyltransferase-like protein
MRRAEAGCDHMVHVPELVPQLCRMLSSNYAEVRQRICRCVANLASNGTTAARCCAAWHVAHGVAAKAKAVMVGKSVIPLVVEGALRCDVLRP